MQAPWEFGKAEKTVKLSTDFYRNFSQDLFCTSTHPSPCERSSLAALDEKRQIFSKLITTSDSIWKQEWFALPVVFEEAVTYI